MRSRTRKPDTDPLVADNSDCVGRFWFERSRSLVEDGRASHRGISSRELQQLRELEASRFFDDARLRESVVKCNDEASEAPRLRALDWAVTNFAKGHPLVMLVKDAGGREAAVDPNLSYEGELRRHHRLLFDPFRRGTHIFFELDGMIHRTTTGQLTFVKWCIHNGVDKYVEDNLPEIREHMAAATRRGDPRTAGGGAGRESGAGTDSGSRGSRHESGAAQGAKDAPRVEMRTAEKRRRELTKAPTRRVRGAVSTTFQILTETPGELGGEVK